MKDKNKIFKGKKRISIKKCKKTSAEIYSISQYIFTQQTFFTNKLTKK